MVANGESGYADEEKLLRKLDEKSKYGQTPAMPARLPEVELLLCSKRSMSWALGRVNPQGQGGGVEVRRENFGGGRGSCGWGNGFLAGHRVGEAARRVSATGSRGRGAARGALGWVRWPGETGNWGGRTGWHGSNAPRTGWGTSRWDGPSVRRDGSSVRWGGPATRRVGASVWRDGPTAWHLAFFRTAGWPVCAAGGCIRAAGGGVRAAGLRIHAVEGLGGEAGQLVREEDGWGYSAWGGSWMVGRPGGSGDWSPGGWGRQHLLPMARIGCAHDDFFLSPRRSGAFYLTPTRITRHGS